MSKELRAVIYAEAGGKVKILYAKAVNDLNWKSLEGKRVKEVKIAGDEVLVSFYPQRFYRLIYLDESGMCKRLRTANRSMFENHLMHCRMYAVQVKGICIVEE